MPDRDRSDIDKALTEKGFSSIAGKKHDIYILTVEGKKQQIGTFLSRGSHYKSYGADLLRKMSVELKINLAELLRLIDCNMKYAQYIEILKKKKVL